MNYDEAQKVHDDNVYLEGEIFNGKQISLLLIIEAGADIYSLGKAIQDFSTYGKICWPNKNQPEYELFVFFDLNDYLSLRPSYLDWMPLSLLLDRLSKK